MYGQNKYSDSSVDEVILQPEGHINSLSENKQDGHPFEENILYSPDSQFQNMPDEHSSGPPIEENDNWQNSNNDGLPGHPIFSEDEQLDMGEPIFSSDDMEFQEMFSDFEPQAMGDDEMELGGRGHPVGIDEILRRFQGVRDDDFFLDCK